MTQRELARRLRVSTATISRWENDQQPPMYKDLEALAPLLGIAMEQLVNAIGLRLSPPPETELYSPLVDLLGKMSLREQRALYGFLDEAGKASGR